MQDKLQQLTEKLYNEGLAKGKQEAEALLQSAKEESEKMLADAKEECRLLKEKTQKECSDLKAKAEGDIKTASRQALSQIKQDIEGAVRMQAVSAPVKEALSSSEFMQSLIKTVVSAFGADKEATGLDLVLPESMKENLSGFLNSEIASSFSKGLDVSFSKDLGAGFKVSRKGSGYFIDFSNDSFEKIIAEYIRPKTRKLIFGE